MPIGSERTESRRNLPHWQQAGATYFVTFRLRQGEMTEAERRVVLDACLFWHEKKWTVEAVTVMPDHMHLLVPPLPVASGDSREQLCYDLGEIVGSVKKFSARRIQQDRGSQGSLWQDERHDHMIRNEREWDEKLDYIADNAVKRGLACHWRDYPLFWYRRADYVSDSAQ